MHRVAYIFPPLTAGVLVVLFRNYDLWWMYITMTAVSELILWSIIRRVSRTPEYLSGYALNVQHHEPRVERVVRTETYRDSQGNTRTKQVVDYIHHPDVWLMPLNTGADTEISTTTTARYGIPRSIGSIPLITIVSEEEAGNYMNGTRCMKMQRPRHIKAYTATESYFIEHNELDLLSFAEWLQENIVLWKRKEFKDFKYLGVKLSTGRKAIVATATIVLCILMIIVTINL